MLTAADVELLRVRASIRAEFPGFGIVHKERYWYMRWIDVLLKVLTFWHMTRFMHYTTTIGDVVYMSEDWADIPAYEQAALLRHEWVHMKQRRRLGPVRFIFTYLFWPLPAGVALGRRDLEMEAYRETLKAYFEYYGEFVAIDAGIKTRVVGHFLGAEYIWMWPFRKTIERWYDATIAELAAETRAIVHGKNQKG